MMRASLDQLTVQFVFHTAGHARGGNLRTYTLPRCEIPLGKDWQVRLHEINTRGSFLKKPQKWHRCQPYWTVSNQRTGRRQDGWRFSSTAFVADCHDGDDRRFPYDGIRWFGLWLCQSKCGRGWEEWVFERKLTRSRLAAAASQVYVQFMLEM